MGAWGRGAGKSGAGEPWKLPELSGSKIIIEVY